MNPRGIETSCSICRALGRDPTPADTLGIMRCGIPWGLCCEHRADTGTALWRALSAIELGLVVDESVIYEERVPDRTNSRPASGSRPSVVPEFRGQQPVSGRVRRIVRAASGST